MKPLHMVMSVSTSALGASRQVFYLLVVYVLIACAVFSILLALFYYTSILRDWWLVACGTRDSWLPRTMENVTIFSCQIWWAL